MAAVFSMQGFGQFFAAIVALITTNLFRKSFSTALSVSTCQGDCQLAADRSWRIIIGFGMLFPLSSHSTTALLSPRHHVLHSTLP